MSLQAKYQKAAALRKADPAQSIHAVCKKVGITAAAYYYWQGKDKPKTKRKPKRQKYEQIQSAPTSSALIPVVMCTPEQIRGMFQ